MAESERTRSFSRIDGAPNEVVRVGTRGSITVEARSGPNASSLLVDAEDAAVLVNVSRSTWWKLHASGRCPAPVKLGRRTLWRREELGRWIEAGCPSRAQWLVLGAREPRHE